MDPPIDNNKYVKIHYPVYLENFKERMHPDYITFKHFLYLNNIGHAYTIKEMKECNPGPEYQRIFNAANFKAYMSSQTTTIKIYFKKPDEGYTWQCFKEDLDELMRS